MIKVNLAQSFLIRLCMFCVYTRPRYQMSVYSNSGPLDLFCDGVGGHYAKRIALLYVLGITH